MLLAPSKANVCDWNSKLGPLDVSTFESGWYHFSYACAAMIFRIKSYVVHAGGLNFEEIPLEGWLSKESFCTLKKNSVAWRIKKYTDFHFLKIACTAGSQASALFFPGNLFLTAPSHPYYRTIVSQCNQIVVYSNIPSTETLERE